MKSGCYSAQSSLKLLVIVTRREASGSHRIRPVASKRKMASRKEIMTRHMRDTGGSKRGGETHIHATRLPVLGLAVNSLII